MEIDAYRVELGQLNGRLGQLIKRYAEAYRTQGLTDATAKSLMDEALAMEPRALRARM